MSPNPPREDNARAGANPASEAILAEPVADAGSDEVPGSPQGRSFLFFFVLAWFGLSLATGTIGGAAIPKVFAFLDDDTKGLNLSITAAIGGIVVMVITPLFGRFSDRTMSALGKRRPWILGGALAGTVGVVVLAFSGSVWMVVLGWIIVQCGFGAANAAVHALLADQIPKRIRARVAAVASASAGLALIVGASLIAALPNGAQWSWFIVPGALGALFSALLFFGLRDIVRTERPAPWKWSDVVATYWLDPVRYRDFFWAWSCRLLVTMSIVSVSTYLLFFIIDHLGVPAEEASGVQAITLIIFTVGNIIMTILFGWISDRTGRRKAIVWASCVLSAAGLLVAIAAPDITMFMVGILIVGAAQGAYVSVDIALMTEVLPTFEEAGKDLGIVALSYQLPQLLVPVVAVPLLAIGGGENYTALYVAAIVFAVLGGLSVLPIKSVR
ncbi:MFS transporter [Microbacterium lushaniae]|uniref:MFS transporter n=1 Tax=Microbacterium lushaniae TaxID=2614639 RepID=A0A5J6L6D5_9MICO|nr:MFS transporter [Microbacterium lushaniae]QEW04078.1 MFS transporter [Microbacterium lushaniae]